MLKPIHPTVDEHVNPWAGRSRGGQPMSFNRAPSEDLSPWLSRISATPVDLPEGYQLHSGLFNDCPMVRIQLTGDYRMHAIDGVQHHHASALIFGPHSRFMPISVTGSFNSVGMALRPGAAHALFGIDTGALVDRIVPFEAVGLDSADMLGRLGRFQDPAGWVEFLERSFRRLVEAKGRPMPDPVTTAFETLCYADPSAQLAPFARQIGMSMRQLQRIIHRDFGMAPKQVLRRARAMDMASHLRGVADEQEAEELVLRYYDQAQMTREFTELFGMTPRQFVKTPNALLTLTLEARQAHRLLVLNRLMPGHARPWQ
jgi:AraC-like DNA-binding protein